MINIVMVVSDNCMGSTIFSALDLLTTANYLNKSYCGHTEDFCQVHMVGTSTYQTAFNGQKIGPLMDIQAVEKPDVLLLPSIEVAVASKRRAMAAFKKFEPWFPIFREWQKQGTIIASTCSGNLLIAAAGLSRQRPLTCHWINQTIAQELFPHEQFRAESSFFDHGDLISSGGAMSINQLILYLIERLGSRELALYCGKIMLVEPALGKQSRYTFFKPNKAHEDQQVKKMQDWLEKNFDQRINVSNVGREWGISERQLVRRFRKVTGETPGSYLQKIRLDHVKHELENTEQPANNIIWSSGYEDVSSFRRLFKKETGMTMKEYRKRFGMHSYSM